MNISEHTFLVSGGASGLGAATAQRLIQGGATVLIADRDAAAAKALAGQLGAAAHAVPTDVTDEAEVAAAVEAARARHGGLHGAVCCAGIGIPEKLLGDDGPHRLDSFERTLRVNLLGSFNVARLAAAAMAKQAADADGNRGVIVMTASIAAFEGQIGQIAYAASKAGIVGMTLPMARELARHGIRVVTIAPGIFDTPMLAGLSDEVRQSLGEQIPFPSRLGRPDEYAALVQHIVENDMLNGETIRLDGAMRMAAR